MKHPNYNKRRALTRSRRGKHKLLLQDRQSPIDGAGASHPQDAPRLTVRSRARTLPERRLFQERALREFNIRSCFIGHKVKEGQRTRRLALVCLVDRKLPRDQLPPSHCLPKALSVRIDGKSHSIPVDVVEAPSLQYQARFNPGDLVYEERTQERATIGAHGHHATAGSVFVTAGHFARHFGDGAQVVLGDSTSPATVYGTIVGHRLGGGFDYAFVRSPDPTDQTNSPVDSIYEPVLRTDLNQDLYVLTTRGPVLTYCRGIGMQYYDQDTNDLLVDLIVTDPATLPGDSGAALVDRHYRLWGFLIGTIESTYSVFMPAVKLLAAENILLGR